MIETPGFLGGSRSPFRLAGLESMKTESSMLDARIFYFKVKTNVICSICFSISQFEIAIHAVTSSVYLDGILVEIE